MQKLNKGIINYEKSTDNIVKIIFILNYIVITDPLNCKLKKIRPIAVFFFKMFNLPTRFNSDQSSFQGIKVQEKFTRKLKL